MNRRRDTLRFAGIFLLGVSIVIGLTWLNIRFISQDSGQNDFLPGWAGTRWFMIRGWSPYSMETTEGIQNMIYGHPARPSEDQGYFLYPFYSSFILAPFSLIGNYDFARALWMTLIEISLLIVFLASLSLSYWRPAAWILILVLGFTFTWYHSVLALLDSDMLILCSLFMVFAFMAIRSGNDVLAGFLLALTTIRPEPVLVLLLFVLVWAVSRERWLLFWSMFASIGFMIAITSLLIPDWIFQSLQQIYLYYSKAISYTPRGLLSYWLPGVGNQLGWALSAVIVGILLWEWRASLRKDFRWFLWTAYLTLAGSQLIGIYTSLESYVILLPAFILILATWDQRWGKLGRLLVLLSIILMFVGSWGLSVFGVRRGVPPTLDPLLMLMAPIFMMLGLYWVRWWAIKPPYLPLETFSKHLRGGRNLL